jgi:diguanylate cyclase (GGDEF)-like protein
LTVGFWLFYVQGFSKVLFGQMPGIDQKMLWIWAGQFITWGTVFSISFLDLRKTNRVLFIIMAIAAILSVIVSVAGLIGFYAVAFTLSHILGIAVPALIIIAAVVRLLQGYKSASYYLVGWSFMAVGGAVFSLMGLQVLPVHPLTINALSIGIVFESVFLAMALFDRFKMLEKEKAKLVAEQAHYRELSLTDTLTGLKNRRYLMIELQNAIQSSLQNGEPLSVISLDIDDFKKINDRFGHEIGDDILIALAHSIRSCTRETDAACLYGGDEIIIFTPKTSKDKAYAIAERIRMHFEVESLRVINGVNLAATISLGIVEYMPEETIDTLLSRADDALYRAKRRGKNCSVVS